MSLDKLAQLRMTLSDYGSCLVAYSGGVDSVFLAWVAHQELGARSLAVIADSPSLPRRELDEALTIGAQFGFPVRVIRTREFEDPNYSANPVNRCYFCKAELFEELTAIAKAERFEVIVYGENASDVGDFRPGVVAAQELQVRAPLKEVGLTKAEIRTLSANLGLPTSDKAQMACLSSRIPHGEPVTVWKLEMIEAAEALLKDLGFRDVRVRLHELSPSGGAEGAKQRANEDGLPRRSLARIELGQEEMPRLWQENRFLMVASKLQAIGFAHVTVDLAGYRRGGAAGLDIQELSGALRDGTSKQGVVR